MKFKHPDRDWTVDISLQGPEKYDVKINDTLVSLFPKSLLLTKKMGRVRKSDIKVFDNNIFL